MIVFQVSIKKKLFYSDTIFNGKKAANQYSDEKAVDVKKVLFFLRGISLTEIGRNTRTVAKYTTGVIQITNG